mgnify:CR=1 FL=1
MIEVYLTVSVGPIPFATMVNREWGSTGQNYLRSLLALGFQAFLIMICVGIYAVLVEGISKLQRGLMLKNYGYQRWVAATVVAGCIIALGILLIFNPFNALVITMRVLGIVLAADGMAGLWVNFIIKRYYQ